MPYYEAACCGKRFEDEGGQGYRSMEEHTRTCRELNADLKARLDALSSDRKQQVITYLEEGVK